MCVCARLKEAMYCKTQIPIKSCGHKSCRAKIINTKPFPSLQLFPGEKEGGWGEGVGEGDDNFLWKGEGNTVILFDLSFILDNHFFLLKSLFEKREIFLEQ